MKDSSILDKDNSNQNTMAYAHQSPYHTFNRLLTAGVSLLVLAAAVIFPLTSHAATTAQLYLSPASQSVTNGSNMVFSVILNAGGNTITSARTVVSFSTARFSYVNTTPGSAFGVFPAPTVAGGTIDFTGGAIGGVTGVQTVATITLKAISTGSSTVSLAGVCAVGVYSGCSATYDNSPSADNVLSTIAGGTYTVNAPPVTPPPTTPPPATPPASGGGGTTTPPASGGGTAPVTTPTAPGTPAATPVVANAPPTIVGVTVTNIGDTTATINWTTDVPATSVVQYGLNTQYGLVAQDGTLTTDHHVTLNSLSKGIAYSFIATSAAATGASANSDGQQFTTTGFDVTVHVVDKDGKPLSNVEVTLAGKTLTTDASGLATFQNVPAGEQAVSMKGATTNTKAITVGAYKAGTTQYEPQQFSLTATKNAKRWVYALAGLAILIVLGVILRPRRPHHGGKDHDSGVSVMSNNHQPVSKTITGSFMALASKIKPPTSARNVNADPSIVVGGGVAADTAVNSVVAVTNSGSAKIPDPVHMTLAELEALVRAKPRVDAKPLKRPIIADQPPQKKNKDVIRDWLGRRVAGPTPGTMIHPEPKSSSINGKVLTKGGH